MPFDIAFLNAEVERLGGDATDSPEPVDALCEITDSLVLARQKHPGQRNSLDALVDVIWWTTLSVNFTALYWTRKF